MGRVRVVIRWSSARMKIPSGVKRLRCLIGGHADQMLFRNSTLALHCARCGYTSPGWLLDRRPTRSTTETASPKVEERDRPRSGSPPLFWQSEMEGRADADLALGPDFPSMRLDNPLGEVEPEPQSQVV